MEISIKRTLKIGHRLCRFCAIQQIKKAAAISLPQLFGGSWWIRKPRSKKQSAGLFFAVCGRPTCSNPTSSSTKKNPQPKLRVLFVSTLQKGCPLNQPFVCTPTSCSHGIFPVFRHGLSPPKCGWQWQPKHHTKRGHRHS